MVSADKITDGLSVIDDVFYVDINFKERKGTCYVRDGKLVFQDLKRAVDALGYFVIDPEDKPDKISVEGLRVRY